MSPIEIMHGLSILIQDRESRRSKDYDPDITTLRAALEYIDKESAPLVLQEFTAMHGKPVWINFIALARGFWGIVSSTSESEIVFATENGNFHGMTYDYGVNWIAYTRNPEATQQGETT